MDGRSFGGNHGRSGSVPLVHCTSVLVVGTRTVTHNTSTANKSASLDLFGRVHSCIRTPRLSRAPSLSRVCRRHNHRFFSRGLHHVSVVHFNRFRSRCYFRGGNFRGTGFSGARHVFPLRGKLRLSAGPG